MASALHSTRQCISIRSPEASRDRAKRPDDNLAPYTSRTTRRANAWGVEPGFADIAVAQHPGSRPGRTRFSVSEPSGA